VGKVSKAKKEIKIETGVGGGEKIKFQKTELMSGETKHVLRCNF
jgi:hypothetical protein